MIPPKIIIKGDLQSGHEYVGYAKRLLAELLHAMSFQRLNEGFSVTTPFPGVVVECFASHSLKVISVSTIGGRERETRKHVEESERRKCLCFPHVSIGRVKASYPYILSVPEHTGTLAEYNDAVALYEESIEIYNEFLTSAKAFTYDVEVCSIGSYVLYSEVHDANFGKYSVGQVVLVAVGYVIDGEEDRWETFPGFYSYPCDRTCLTADPSFPNIIIIPAHITDEADAPLMDKWYFTEQISRVIADGNN